jgi:AraC-like DNA-binding protein
MNIDLKEKLIHLGAYTNNGCVNRHWVKKNNDETISSQIIATTSFLDDNVSFSTRLFVIKNDIHEYPRCSYCGNEIKNIKKKQKFCSNRCSTLSPITKEKLKQTNLERYGIENGFQLKDKIRETNLKRYGVEHSGQSEEIKERIKSSILERYGVENAFQSEEIKEKIRETNLDRYGVEHAAKLNAVQEKRKQTNLKLYGVENPLQSKEVMERVKRTNLERYGVENPLQVEQIKEKIKQTNLDRYGCTSPLHSPKIKKKIMDNLIKNGMAPSLSLRKVSKEQYERLNDVQWLKNRHHNDSIPIKDIADELSVSVTHIYRVFNEKNITLVNYNSSQFEKEIYEFIQDVTDKEIKRNYRKLIPPYEIDIYIPELNLGIECNGIWWHSEATSTPKSYHLNKTQLCEKKNTRLIHIFENEWFHQKNIVKSRISSVLNFNDKIWARKCDIRLLSSKDKKLFFNNTHLQGDAHASVSLGLYYDDELVSAMSFGKPRFNKRFQWELIRFSNKAFLNVVGGASRLFQYFIKNWDPDSIISYSDRRWNTGVLYEKIGFKPLSTSGPNFWIVDTKNCLLENRLKFQKHKLSSMLKNFDPSLTAHQNMIDHGYTRVWDCGNLVYQWKNV